MRMATPYGLSFVQSLRPVKFKWDERSKYEGGRRDGKHKSEKFTLGFFAQDVISVEKAYGAIDRALLIADDEQPDNLKLTETKLIPVLVKAIQELSADFSAYKDSHP